MTKEMPSRTGDNPPQVGAGELSLLLQEVIQEYRIQAARVKLTMAVDLGPFNGTITTDVAVMRSILSGLLDNAIRFSRPTGLVHIQAGFHGNDFEFRVQNSWGPATGKNGADAAVMTARIQIKGIRNPLEA